MTEDSHAIRVMLVDDHQMVLDGLRACLESDGGIQVVGEAGNGREALDRAEDLQPDVVIMDVSMPVMNGLEATGEFRGRFPAIKVLILSMHDNREYILQLIRSGAAGYVLKDAPSDHLIKAIETVHQGGTYFSSGASSALFDPEEPIQQEQPLSDREQSVLIHVANGLNNKEIADVLCISVRTVETHRQNIKKKLNTRTTAELTKYALEHGFIR